MKNNNKKLTLSQLENVAGGMKPAIEIPKTVVKKKPVPSFGTSHSQPVFDLLTEQKYPVTPLSLKDKKSMLESLKLGDGQSTFESSNHPDTFFASTLSQTQHINNFFRNDTTDYRYLQNMELKPDFDGEGNLIYLNANGERVADKEWHLKELLETGFASLNPETGIVEFKSFN